MILKTTEKQKRRVLAIAFAVAIIQPLIVLPQVLQIFSTHSAKDVSLLTWGLLAFFNACNFFYGLVFDIRPLVIGNALWVIVDALVVAGILLYR